MDTVSDCPPSRTRRLRARVLGACALVSTLVTAMPPAEAARNGVFNAQLFRPSSHYGDQTHAVGAQLAPRGSWGVGLMTSYGINPLVLVDTHDSFSSYSGPDEEFNIVSQLLTLDVFGTYTLFDWLDLGLEIPVHLLHTPLNETALLDWTEGVTEGLEGFEAYESVAFGDMRLSLKIQFVDPAETTWYGIATRIVLGFPTGDPQGFVSDGFTGEATFIADFRGYGLWFGLNAGLRLQAQEPVPTDLNFIQWAGTSILYATGLTAHVVGDADAWTYNDSVHLSLEADVHGITVAEAPFDSTRAANLETLFGVNVSFPKVGLGLRVGGGAGWLERYGAPDGRLYAGLTFFDAAEDDAVVADAGATGDDVVVVETAPDETTAPPVNQNLDLAPFEGAAKPTAAQISPEHRASLQQKLVRWLDEPDVKLVAVEVYSDYCEPCKQAAPRWESLRQRYAAEGLKLVVINVDDYDSDRQCKTLPWRPDLLMCDPGLGEALGVCQGGRCSVPQAFLWSWQGNLLVPGGKAHIDDVEAAIQAYLDASPRVVIEAASSEGTADPRLRRLLEAELGRAGKLTVLTDDKERRRLKALMKKTHDPSRRDDQRCVLGAEASPNMRLLAETFGESLSLSLQNLESHCGTTVVADWNSEKAEASVRKAVYQLMNRLMHRPPKVP